MLVRIAAIAAIVAIGAIIWKPGLSDQVSESEVPERVNEREIEIVMPPVPDHVPRVYHFCARLRKLGM